MALHSMQLLTCDDAVISDVCSCPAVGYGSFSVVNIDETTTDLYHSVTVDHISCRSNILCSAIIMSLLHQWVVQRLRLQDGSASWSGDQARDLAIVISAPSATACAERQQ